MDSVPASEAVGVGSNPTGTPLLIFFYRKYKCILFEIIYITGYCGKKNKRDV